MRDDIGHEEKDRSSVDSGEVESLLKPIRQKSESRINEIITCIDEQVNIKLLVKVWGPRMELCVRLMLVMTFLDDSCGMFKHFGQQVDTVANNGYPFRWLVSPAPNFATFTSTIVLGLGMCTQLCGSFIIILNRDIELAIKALICWVCLQPFIYAQLSNIELVSESLSILGGMILLYVHAQTKHEQSEYDSCNSVASCIGRLLLPAAYLYQAIQLLYSAKRLDETTSIFSYISSLSTFLLNIIALVATLIGCSLVAIGLKSRFIAILFACINLFLVCHRHPLWKFLSLQDGKWQVNEIYMWMPNVLMEDDEAGTLDSIDPWEIYNLHQYYFFLGLSTSGALLLLAQLGPGEIAVQKNEIILPVLVRNLD